MNSRVNVFPYQQNANPVLPGMLLTDVFQLPTLVQVELITMVLNVFHTNHATREEYGMIL